MARGSAVDRDRPTEGGFRPGEGSVIRPALRTALSPLASLKLTVALFGLAIFIVFAGTMAQTQKDIWVVVREYFRTPIAWIDFSVFFPKAFFSDEKFPDLRPISGGFYFPGGWLIGFLMAVNLIAAHAVRFTVQSSGSRLKTGLGVIALGCLVTWLVILGGTSDGLQGLPFFEWSTLWVVVKVALLGLSIAGVYLVTLLSPERRIERRSLAALSAAMGGLALWLFYEGDRASLGDSSMRILWQLLQGTFAGLVLLGGCWLVFRKRAGIVLLHSGIGLMMLSELLVGTFAVENQMHITEGETVNFVQDLHTCELAIVDPSYGDEDQVVVIPQSILLGSSQLQHSFLPRWLFEPLPQVLQRFIGCKPGEKVIRHEDLPFDVEVVRFLKNSTRPRRPSAHDDNPATSGTGKDWVVGNLDPGTGTDADSKIDMSSAYVKLLRKGTDESLGTYLVGFFLSMQGISEKVTADGKTYDVSLRFKRTYKPYSLQLADVRADNYLGSEMTRNYSSDVRLVDPTRHVDRQVHIWMNNPLRFAGETFYQSSVSRDPDTGAETTGLQVVANTGWMIPYVSCMIVGVGMLFQFTVTLLRFLKRRDPGDVPVDKSAPAADALHGGLRQRSVDLLDSHVPIENGSNSSSNAGATDAGRSVLGARLARLFPWAVVVLFAAYVLGKAQPPRVPGDAFNFYEAGKLPIVYQGRVKPLDTLARNSLKIVSWKETFTDEKGQTQPAVRWLLDVAMNPELAQDYKVFWIDSPDVLELFQLGPRKSHLYSAVELKPHIQEFAKKLAEARDTPPERLTVLQRRLAELDRRMREIKLLQGTFLPPEIGRLPSSEDLQSHDPEAMERVAAFREALVDAPRRLAAVHPPLIVPTKVDSRDPLVQKSDKQEKFEWQPFSTAWTRSLVKTQLLRQDPDPATSAWSRILTAFAKGDAAEFNQAVREYKGQLAKDPPAEMASSHVDFESFFNNFAPFYYSAVLYLCVFALAALSWLVWTGPLNRAALGVIFIALAVHSFALVSRMYISGRPPVTNLYTTAVFIGWGCVVLCLIFELFYRSGIGNVIAGVTGFATLLISHFLSGDGDTFTVLQAVLDTQFWLATHVVIINMGYATTLLAGVLGVMYILRGFATPSLTARVEQDLSRMIYGTLCFAIFFSFVGTVLGGLWADDSWGRFWGWDPKENGALLIVLWNALVLHARWGKMVASRGLAVLAVAGGIITSWSWFGVNELGVGLHSYGFTAGVLQNLGIFAGSQLLVIAVGSLPKQLWWSYRARRVA